MIAISYMQQNKSYIFKKKIHALTAVTMSIEILKVTTAIHAEFYGEKKRKTKNTTKKQNGQKDCNNFNFSHYIYWRFNNISF